MTCSAYERDLSACLDYLQAQGIEGLAEVRVTNLRAFLAEEQKQRPSESSQARTTAALKSAFRFLVEEERLVRDPALPLRTRIRGQCIRRGADGAGVRLDLQVREGELVYKARGGSAARKGTPVVRKVVRTGDFEAVLTWAVGLSDRVDFRVTHLENPARLVVDLRNH